MFFSALQYGAFKYNMTKGNNQKFWSQHKDLDKRVREQHNGKNPYLMGGRR